MSNKITISGVHHLRLIVIEKAVALFEEHGVEHGEVRDAAFGITILSFSDPDGIQVELTAPLE